MKGPGAVAALKAQIEKWNEEKSNLHSHGISYKVGGSTGQHGKKAREKGGPPGDGLKKTWQRIHDAARSLSKRKLGVIDKIERMRQ